MSLVTFAITEGNPGALAFVMAAYAKDLFKAEHGFQRMRDSGITGSRLYMLWNDCCNRDTEMAMDIMSNKAIDDILHHIDDGKGFGIPFEKMKIPVKTASLQTPANALSDPIVDGHLNQIEKQ